MITIENLWETVPLNSGDEVVAAMQFRDQVLIVTRLGQVYRLVITPSAQQAYP